MIPQHSNLVSFDFAFNGDMHCCSFFITDGRILTVSVAGHRKSGQLGSTPPLALAESMAAELLGHESVVPLAPAPKHQGAIETAFGWLATHGTRCSVAH